MNRKSAYILFSLIFFPIFSWAETKSTIPLYQDIKTIEDAKDAIQDLRLRVAAILSEGNFTQVGTIIPWPSTTTIPSKWLQIQGQSLSTTTYSKLFAVTGYVYGGSGANFNLPDLRGVFMKGHGQQGTASFAGANYTGTNGTYTQDKFQMHWHNLYSNDGTALTTRVNFANGANGISPTEQGSGGSANVSDARDVKTDGVNGTPRTGAVTEPASLGMNFIIYTGI